MNASILQKCLTELQKAEPDISYLRGMLETLIEISGAGQLKYNAPISLNNVAIPFLSSNAGIPTPSNIDEIKKMAL